MHLQIQTNRDDIKRT